MQLFNRRSLFLVVVMLVDYGFADEQSDSFTNATEFRQIMLDVHNQYRAQHNASALSWNTTLANYAEGVSKTCVFKHSDGPYGENLVAGYLNATASADAWGEEEKEYSFSDPGFADKTGHFTQMVWKATTTVGCAAVDCDGLLTSGQKSWFLTCEYWPPGNVANEYKENVLASSTGGSSSAAAGRMRSEVVLAQALGMTMMVVWWTLLA